MIPDLVGNRLIMETQKKWWYHRQTFGCHIWACTLEMGKAASFTFTTSPCPREWSCISYDKEHEHDCWLLSSNMIETVNMTMTLVVSMIVIISFCSAVEQAIVASENFSVTVKPNGEVYWVYPINRQIPCVHKTQKHGLRCSVSLEPNEANDMIHIVTTKNTVDTSLLGTYHDPTFKIESKTLWKI